MTALLKTLTWLKNHKRLAVEAILTAILGASILFGTIVHDKNKKLQNGLEMAENNVEMYQGVINGLNDENNILRLTTEQLKQTNDSILKNTHDVAVKNNIKVKQLETSATQNQTLYVSASKGVRGIDSVYTDSIEYNPYTKVIYTISKDSVDILLDIQNTQYLYVYKSKEYKNKKNFLKRLLTLDFKKVYKYKYNIYNTNDLIKEDDVRVVQYE